MGFESDPRAEAFDLEGLAEPLIFGLERQVLPEPVLADADVRFAAGAWLVARGARTLRLESPDGRSVHEGPVDAAVLSDPVAELSPARLVSLAPSNAEMIDALGCFERVVAAETSSDYPPAVAVVERLGPDLDPNLDRVVELGPDLVVASLTVPGMERVVTGLRARGLRQAILAPRRLVEVMEGAEFLARHLHVPDAGRKVRSDMRAEIERLKAELPQTPRRVYLEWWPRPMFTPGIDCYSNELVALAGGVNVFGQRPGSSLEIGPEELVAADPDVCFVSWCGVAESKLDPGNLMGRAGLEGLRAAQAGRVYPLDETFSGRPGPRMLEASRRMAVHLRGQ